MTNLVDIVRIEQKTSHHIKQKFAQSWMAQYPWPKRCVHDNGGEFIGWEFQEFLAKLEYKTYQPPVIIPQLILCVNVCTKTLVMYYALQYMEIPQNLTKANELI